MTEQKKRQPKQKSYSKLLADVEKAKANIAKAMGNADITIDINKLDAAVQKATPEIAAAVGLPPHLLRVTAEILTPAAEPAAA
jgi:hypothetical protein